MKREPEKHYVKRVVLHLTKKQRKRLVEEMEKKGYKFVAIQHGAYVFCSTIPNITNRLGVLSPLSHG